MPNSLNPLSGRFDYRGVGYVQKASTPLTTDYDSYDVPTVWVQTYTNKPYILVDKTDGVATWVQFGIAGFDYQPAVKNVVDCTAAPPTEVLGDRYLLDSTVGTVNVLWDGAAKDDIVEFDGSLWVSHTPVAGMIVYIETIGKLYFYDGSDWLILPIAIHDATTIAKGVVEIATEGETVAGALADYHVVNPVGLKAKLGVQTNHSVLVGAGTATALTALAIGTDGQVLVGDTANDPVFATLYSADTSITYTIGAGTLALAVTQATESQLGGGEIATAIETTAGTSDVLLITPSKLNTKLGTQTTHGIAIGAGTTANVAWTTAGTVGQPLLSGGASADPDWGTLSVAYGGTGNTTLTAHGVLIGNTTSAIAATAAGTATQVLQSGGASADPVWSTFTIPGTFAQGDVLYSSAANTISGLTKDANATRYIANSGTTNNPAWAQITLTNGVTGVLPIANGGTGASSITDHAIIVGSATAAVTEIGPLTNGQLVVGSTTADPVAATLTAGSGISVTNAAGSITITSTGSGIAWTDVTGTTQAMAINNGYVANNASLVTLTLPDTAVVGSAVQVAGLGAGLFRVAVNAGETIHFGNQDCTQSTGTVTATHRYDAIELVCVVDSVEWSVIESVGNFTIA